MLGGLNVFVCKNFPTTQSTHICITYEPYLCE